MTPREIALAGIVAGVVLLVAPWLVRVAHRIWRRHGARLRQLMQRRRAQRKVSVPVREFRTFLARFALALALRPALLEALFAVERRTRRDKRLPNLVPTLREALQRQGLQGAKAVLDYVGERIDSEEWGRLHDRIEGAAERGVSPSEAVSAAYEEIGDDLARRAAERVERSRLELQVPLILLLTFWVVLLLLITVAGLVEREFMAFPLLGQ